MPKKNALTVDLTQWEILCLQRALLTMTFPVHEESKKALVDKINGADAITVTLCK